MSDPMPTATASSNGKTAAERLAEAQAGVRAEWEAAGTSLSFEDWRAEWAQRRRAEQLERDRREQQEQAQAARVAALAKQIPARYRDAETDDPSVIRWVEQLLAWRRELRRHPDAGCRRTAVDWCEEPRRDPLDADHVSAAVGPSLLLLGATGVGKTHHAFAALRRYVAAGGEGPIVISAAADLYASLRPRPGLDSEESFARFAKAPVLFVDDLGAAKTSEWVEEINYRLINYRYNHQLSTLFTSNVPAKELGGYLGDRVASRIVGMTETVVLRGSDRRRKTAS